MLCVIIKGPSIEEAHQQIVNALEQADIVELRLDYFDRLDLSSLETLRLQYSIPMIFSLRSQLQGGNYSQTEEKRLADIEQLAALKPDYLDLENFIAPDFVSKISSQFPEIKIILSTHNCEETPDDENLEKLYLDMKKIPAFFYKIAVTARHPSDPLRLLSWAKKFDKKLIAISMGMDGQISRILGPMFGNPVTYAALDENQQSAPGQLTAQLLLNRYRHHSLNPLTRIYGLIGNPVEPSISDETHNGLIAACGLDAVYLKINVRPSELADFLKLAKQLPFSGLSVTMPLKEYIIPCLDEINPQADAIGAVNTLLFENGNIIGFNTDGIGALNAIENICPVQGKRIVMIGAGGAAKAIAYEAIRRGGKVIILNRDAQKAVQMAESFSCEGKGLEEMAACAESGYDILINSTPSPLPIDPAHILPQAIVMDIKTKPKDTLFLKHAKEKGCRVIYGYQMFIEQAIGQFHLWFNTHIQAKDWTKLLKDKVVEAIENKHP
jgi:3-dehydroquinate dehydratase/shikimate dehydrogenase